MKRVEALDFARVISMLSVIMIHVTAPYIEWNSDVTLCGMNLAFFLNQACRFSVPLFVLLSGASLGLKGGAVSAAAFWKKRLLKIGVPYLVWFFLYELDRHSFSLRLLAEEAAASPAAALERLLTGQAAPHLYFIIIVLQLYLLYPLLAAAIRRSPAKALLTALLLTYAAQCLFDFGREGVQLLSSGLAAYLWLLFPTWLFYFVLGACCSGETLQKAEDFCRANRWVLLVTAAAVLFFFRDRLFPPKDVTEEEPPPPPIEAPIQYALGDDVRVLALPAGGKSLVYDAEPRTFEEVPEVPPEEIVMEKLTAVISAATFSEDYVEPEPEPEPEEGEEEEVPVAVAYRYVNLADPVEMVERYAAMLTAEDVGFKLAGKDLKPTKNEPYFGGFAGEAYLTYEVPKPEPELDEDGNEIEPEEEWKPVAVAMRLEWRGDTCTVTLDLVPVSMVRAPVEHTTAVGGGFATTLTFSGAVDTVKAMHPSVLGLTGDSMESYRVYSRDGIVKINDQPCMRLDVYSYNETIGANVIAGNFYLSSDGRRLYQFDEVNRKMTELSMTAS